MDFKVGDYLTWYNDWSDNNFYYKIIDFNKENNKFKIEILNPIELNNIFRDFSKNDLKNYFKKITVPEFIAGKLIEGFF